MYFFPIYTTCGSGRDRLRWTLSGLREGFSPAGLCAPGHKHEQPQAPCPAIPFKHFPGSPTCPPGCREALWICLSALSLSPTAWLGPEASAAPEADAEHRSASPDTQRDAAEEGSVSELWGRAVVLQVAGFWVSFPCAARLVL